MLKLQYRKTVDIDLLYHNPRTINDKDFEKLCQSLRDNPVYFEARPIILSNRTGIMTVIAGNMRLRAAIEIGMKEVPTVLIEDLTEEQEREIVIRDNVSNGKWDWDMLANEWNDDQLVEWGVELPFGLNSEKPADQNLSDQGSVNDEEEQIPTGILPQIIIELNNDERIDTIELEIKELLKSYPEARLK